MGEDQEFKHACKFCSKSFPCGRSLGGHMRSHMNNNNNSVEFTDDKLCKKKLVNVNNGGNDVNIETGFEAGINGSYILRENPKKTWRLADHSSEDTSVHVHDKFCKQCGKGFQSWKALFGHMKCHSDKERTSNNSLEDQDSWTSAGQKLVMDSQSDNETAAPSKRRRSKRRTRYMGTANSSMSEIEQEQEEVALSLMMLSRDVSHWGGSNSVAESSENNSVFLEDKIEIKASICNPKVVQKLKKQKVKKLESAIMDSETFQTGAEQSEFCSSGLYEVELSKNSVIQTEVDRSKLGSNKFNSSMKKFQDQSHDPELKSGSLNKLKTDVLDSDEFCKDPQKRSKFECITCNKIFHSYQALGGHRASHKTHPPPQFKSSIETKNSHDPTADSKVVKSIGKETPAIDNSVADSDDNKGEVSYGVIIKKRKGHECPICLKVFQSGQALGGHKRSHFVAEAKENQNQTVLMQNPIPEIRDFLDLNLPAPIEEEASSVHVRFKPWCVVGNSSSSHKHEPLVGLISN